MSKKCSNLPTPAAKGILLPYILKYLSVLTVVLSIGGWLWRACRRGSSALATQSPIRSQDIYHRLMQLPMYTWYYKHSTSRHLGTMAQDWKAAFPLLGGKQRTMISVIDALGVLMVAVQWQGHLIEEQVQRIQQLQEIMVQGHHRRIE